MLSHALIATNRARKVAYMNRELAEADSKKAARMRLLSEDKIYVEEYSRCLERIEARKRIKTRHLYSNTRSTA